MRNILPVLCLIGFTVQAEDFTPAAYIGAYSLNQDSNTLNTLGYSYKIKDVDVGFLLLKANASCSFSNITDGSHTNPITTHIEKYQDFITQYGGTLGLVFSGAEGSNAIDPLNLCTTDELTNFIRDSINTSQVPIKRIVFDIESHLFQTGQLNDAYYDKLLSVSSNIKLQFNTIEVKVTFPQYSSYWALGYNDSLSTFITNGNNVIDYVEIMTSSNASQVVSWINTTMTQLPSLIESKTSILLTTGNKDSDEFNATTLKSQFPTYAGVTTLVTDAASLSDGNARLFNSLNSTEEIIPPIDPEDNLTLTIRNISSIVGFNPYLYENDTVLMNIGYIAPNASITYNSDSYVSTDSINGKNNVSLKVNYWNDIWATCSTNYNFINDTSITVLIEPSTNTVTCN